MARPKKKTAVIIGAGPAGLTAAYELLGRTDIRPIVLEAGGRRDVGGIAKTINYKGNRMDVGGHRFFSKSDRVMEWWNAILPVQRPDGDGPIEVSYRGKTRPLDASGSGPDPAKEDKVMLVRHRVSRIFYEGKFFDYPISLNPRTVRNLGVLRIVKIGFSYMRARLSPRRPERTLEDFLINRFGRELFRAFFRDYTEKVWGVSCHEISADWGAQRIKGLSITKAVVHAVKSLLPKKRDISQKKTETSLIEQFLYPKLGPGQMWQEVAKKVEADGGTVRFGKEVVGLEVKGKRVVAAKVKDRSTGRLERFNGDYFFSTMPVRDLIAGLEAKVPPEVRRIAEGLVYRDFITVGLLVNCLRIGGGRGTVPDNWIYIQDPDVKIGRLQIFNNWSPYMVKDPKTIWIGLEYFCDEGDELWSRSDRDLKRFGAMELAGLGIIDEADVIDGTVLRVVKTYPAYFGTYDEFETLRRYTDRFENLFLIGRNGMHRYNNQDHSMLTAMTAVDNITAGRKSKDNIWEINTEEDYLETK